MRRAKPAAVYDREHRYTIDPRQDPAWPGMTPEPASRTTVAGVRGVPAARSWIECAEPVHQDLVREMLHALPGRRVTRVVGWGDQSNAWMACNDGADGNGHWLIAYDVEAAARDLDEARAHRSRPRRARAARRLAAILAALAVLAAVVWMAGGLTRTHPAAGPAGGPVAERAPGPDHHALVDLTVGAAVVVVLAAATVLARRRTHSGTTHSGTTQSGTTQSGTTQSGTTQSGTTQSGTTQSGTTQPGTTQPGTTQPSSNQSHSRR